jgi:hypothetical protein
VRSRWGALGREVQGGVGERVPDMDDAPPVPARFFEDAHGEVGDRAFGYELAQDAPEDAAGPEPRASADVTERDLLDEAGCAAAEAAQRVHGAPSRRVLAALEAEEARYDAEHPEAAAPRRAVADAAAPHASPELRARVAARLAQALPPGADAAAAEAALYAGSRSAAVYASLASNAVRVACGGGAADPRELLRVARREPRAAAAGAGGEAVAYVLFNPEDNL